MVMTAALVSREAEKSVSEGDITKFQRIAEKLLRTHFSVRLNQTNLDSKEKVANMIRDGCHPYSAVNGVAEQQHLDRTDKEVFALLTFRDEMAAMRRLGLGSNPPGMG